jgi:hypothetical protein
MTTLRDASAALTQPFASHQIDLKPGALTRDKDRAIAMAYADARVYQERLDQVVGPDAWSVQFSVHVTGVVCTLTICGIVKADVGDYPLDFSDRPNENKATTAAAQAFKRACAQFGVGRFLYSLPRQWADYDPDQKAFIHPQRIIYALYQAAGLAAYITDERAQLAQNHAATNPAEPTPKLARAQAILANAEAKAAHLGRPARPEAAPPPAPTGKPASEKQIRYLGRLLQERAVSADELDGLAHQVGLTTHDLAQLETANLSAKAAGTLIEELLALQALHTA